MAYHSCGKTEKEELIDKQVHDGAPPPKKKKKIESLMTARA